MRSLTCDCISVAVAPGQMAVMTTFLIVKFGSSARPSLRKLIVPATPSARMKNASNAGCRTAHAERLKLRIGVSPLSGSRSDGADDTNLLARIQFLHAEHDDVVTFRNTAADIDRGAVVFHHL